MSPHSPPRRLLAPAFPPEGQVSTLLWCQGRGPGLLLVVLSLSVGTQCLLSDHQPQGSGLWPLACALFWGRTDRLPISQLVVAFGETEI